MKRRDEADKEYGLLTVTMTEDAAHRFNKALRYAEAVVHGNALVNRAPDIKRRIEEHGEWLRWGMSRLDEARRRVSDS